MQKIGSACQLRRRSTIIASTFWLALLRSEPSSLAMILPSSERHLPCHPLRSRATSFDCCFTPAKLTCVTRSFHLSGNEDAFSANIVSLLQAGCFFGSLIAGQVGDKIGRKWALICAGAIFCVGSILQTCSFGNVPVMFTGRAVGGLV